VTARLIRTRKVAVAVGHSFDPRRLAPRSEAELREVLSLGLLRLALPAALIGDAVREHLLVVEIILAVAALGAAVDVGATSYWLSRRRGERLALEAEFGLTGRTATVLRFLGYLERRFARRRDGDLRWLLVLRSAQLALFVNLEPFVLRTGPIAWAVLVSALLVESLTGLVLGAGELFRRRRTRILTAAQGGAPVAAPHLYPGWPVTYRHKSQADVRAWLIAGTVLTAALVWYGLQLVGGFPSLLLQVTLSGFVLASTWVAAGAAWALGAGEYRSAGPPPATVDSNG
jgi:hypothetical protein